MMNSWEGGKAGEFFALWERHLPADVRKRDPTAKKIEWYSQLYFALYELLPGNSSKHSSSSSSSSAPPTNLESPTRGRRTPSTPKPHKPTSSMSAFKAFLETRGSELAKTQEFLPFYALPYVPDPRKHPTFTHLFVPEWAADLRARLHKFLLMTLDSKLSCPMLYTMFHRYKSAPPGSEGGIPAETANRLASLESQLIEAQKREAAALHAATTELRSLRHDFSNVSTVAVETLSALERVRALGPDAVSDQAIESIKARLMIEPGSAPIKDPQESFVPSPNTTFDNTTGPLDTTGPGETSVDTTERTLDSSAPPPPSPAAVAPVATKPKGRATPLLDPILPELDFGDVKSDLIRVPAFSKVMILQALRWRLTRSRPGDARRRVMRTYVQADLLGAIPTSGTYRNSFDQLIRGLVESETPAVREYTLRLLNVIANDTEGRTYLLSCPYLLELLVDVLRLEDGDTIARQNALGVLEKCSLRYHAQDGMMDASVIQWAVRTLVDPEVVSEYTVEYGTGLLMNLLERHRGKDIASDPKVDVLPVMMGLLEYDSPRVRMNVNAVLYYIFSRDRVVEEARALGVPEMIAALMEISDPEISRQLGFVLNKVQQGPSQEDRESYNDPEPPPTDPHDGDVVDDGMDDEDEAAVWEEEEDEEESVDPQDHPQGEDLLRAGYLRSGLNIVKGATSPLMATRPASRLEASLPANTSAISAVAATPAPPGTPPDTPAGDYSLDESSLTEKDFNPMKVRRALQRTPPAGASRAGETPSPGLKASFNSSLRSNDIAPALVGSPEPSRHVMQTYSSKESLSGAIPSLERSLRAPTDDSGVENQRPSTAHGKGEEGGVTPRVRVKNQEVKVDDKQKMEHSFAFSSRHKIVRTPVSGSQMASPGEFDMGPERNVSAAAKRRPRPGPRKG